MAFADSRKHIIGYRLACRQTVFNGESLDIAQLDLTCGDLIGKQRFKHAASLGGNDRTDAVPAVAAYYDLIKRGVVGRRRRTFHFIVARKLLAQYLFKIRNGG